MRRTDLQDTSLCAHRMITKRLREMTASERFRMLFDRIEAGLQIDALARKRNEQR